MLFVALEINLFLKKKKNFLEINLFLKQQIALAGVHSVESLTGYRITPTSVLHNINFLDKSYSIELNDSLTSTFKVTDNGK